MELTRQEISRQLDIVPVDILDENINIIGSGAIGSWSAIALAKMGFSNIAVWDEDKVDIVNMSSQFFGLKDVGKYKVDALSERILEMANVKIFSIPEMWEGVPLSGIVIAAADSMAVRKSIAETNKDNLKCRAIIDARMGAEELLLYSYDPNDPDQYGSYMKTLYTDEESVQAPCTAKSTTYCSLTISSLVAMTVRDIMVGTGTIKNLSMSMKGKDWLCFLRDNQKGKV